MGETKKGRRVTSTEGMNLLAKSLFNRGSVQRSSKIFDNTDIGDVMTIQIPRHEQRWPNKLLPHRLEEYVFEDGRPPTQNRAFAHRVTGIQVVEAIRKAQDNTGLSNIDLRYYVGTCFHEAGCVNEWDTEIASKSCPPGFESVGAYQIGREEAERFGFRLEDMLDLDMSSECFVRLAEANRAALRKYAKIGDTSLDPDYTDSAGKVWAGGSMRAYLGIAHNHGTGYARATIASYGMNWAAYQVRNPSDRIVSNHYGSDCVTGGPQWPDDVLEPPEPSPQRVLELKFPPMAGEDVAELQRHLKITADGSFGPKTKAAVIEFQEKHGLKSDGQVGPRTWAELLKT